MILECACPQVWRPDVHRLIDSSLGADTSGDGVRVNEKREAETFPGQNLSIDRLQRPHAGGNAKGFRRVSPREREGELDYRGGGCPGQICAQLIKSCADVKIASA